VKIARFSTDDQSPQFGIVDDDHLVVLTGDPMYHGFETTGERVPLAQARILAPVIPRSKVVCVGMNYAAHAAEMGHEVAETPLIFMKPNTAVIGPGEPIILPPVEGRITHEGELVIVIGAIAKRVKREDWKDVVFGYTIGNDVSARDVMFADGQWARAKGYDTFAPIGPYIETDIDPTNLEIETFVDGELRRKGNTNDFIHSIPDIIAFITDAWTLLPGDIIMTGTPNGLGGFVDGQTVEIRIEGLGVLSNPAKNRDDRQDPA
jgi:2-keto-4-pentenoate hydratase/2-oxohepta-3-ene-1,7-dioic acid hydratase in catechol pathway